MTRQSNKMPGTLAFFSCLVSHWLQQSVDTFRSRPSRPSQKVPTSKLRLLKAPAAGGGPAGHFFRALLSSLVRAMTSIMPISTWCVSPKPNSIMGSAICRRPAGGRVAHRAIQTMFGNDGRNDSETTTFPGGAALPSPLSSLKPKIKSDGERGVMFSMGWPVSRAGQHPLHHGPRTARAGNTRSLFVKKRDAYRVAVGKAARPSMGTAGLRSGSEEEEDTEARPPLPRPSGHFDD